MFVTFTQRTTQYAKITRNKKSGWTSLNSGDQLFYWCCGNSFHCEIDSNCRACNEIVDDLLIEIQNSISKSKNLFLFDQKRNRTNQISNFHFNKLIGLTTEWFECFYDWNNGDNPLQENDSGIIESFYSSTD